MRGASHPSGASRNLTRFLVVCMSAGDSDRVLASTASGMRSWPLAGSAAAGPCHTPTVEQHLHSTAPASHTAQSSAGGGRADWRLRTVCSVSMGLLLAPVLPTAKLLRLRLPPRLPVCPGGDSDSAVYPGRDSDPATRLSPSRHKGGLFVLPWLSTAFHADMEWTHLPY